MHTRILLPLLALLVFVGFGCSGESFGVAAARQPGGTEADAGVTGPIIAPPEAPAMTTSYGFARHASGDLAAFDRATGAVLARRAFDAPIADVTWDAAHERVLVVVQTPELDGSILHAIGFDGAELSLIGSSEPVTGAARAHVWGDRVVLAAHELATSFWILDALLQPLGPSKALFQPAAFAPSPDAARLFALATSVMEGGVDHDALVRLGFDGQWQRELWLIPAPGRPGSRLARSTEPDTLWLVRKPLEAGRFEIAEIDAQSPAAPGEFRVVASSAEPSSLNDVIVEPTQRVLIAALSKDEVGGGNGALAILPLDVTAPAFVLPVGGWIESSPWPSRQLVHDPATWRVLCATSSGVQAFTASGSQGAPAFAADASFSGVELRAPIALALTTGT